MSRSSRKIVASKASIHADGFTRPGKIRQTSAHHAFKTTARGDVKVIIKEQYPRQDTDSERPPKGTVIKGDSAEISSMTFDMTTSTVGDTWSEGSSDHLFPIQPPDVLLHIVS